MKKRARRNHSPAFKAKVALADLKDDRAIVQLAEQFDVQTEKKFPALGRSQVEWYRARPLGEHPSRARQMRPMAELKVSGRLSIFNRAYRAHRDAAAAKARGIWPM
jgi:transposase